MDGWAVAIERYLQDQLPDYGVAVDPAGRFAHYMHLIATFWEPSTQCVLLRIYHPIFYEQPFSGNEVRCCAETILNRAREKIGIGRPDCEYYFGQSGLKCAVNPTADCETCPDRQPKSR